MLSWSPNTRFSSFPLNQLTAYVFWATANDSPPILRRKRKEKWNWSVCSGAWLSICGENNKKDFFSLPKYKTSGLHQPELVHQSSSGKNDLQRKEREKKQFVTVLSFVLGLRGVDTRVNGNGTRPAPDRQTGRRLWSPACEKRKQRLSCFTLTTNRMTECYFPVSTWCQRLCQS